MNPLAVLGALGGVVVFLTAVTTVVRGIFRSISAIEENTEAVRKLTDVFVDHERRISRLEGKTR